ncbi:MAG TPA: hypothetical protein ENN30_01220 [Candidatus Woesearchaeota archaeon]|nr:hypothetical protein [Candidatus Woesearchaeota archaeon]
MYFKNHFFFHRLDYSLSDCVFVVRYQYTYDHVHTPMSVTIKASGPDDFQIIDSNVLLRPFMAIVSEATALELAEEQKIDYDYYNMEVDIEYQTMVYRFYKETLTEGRKLVFEVDARSKEIRTFQKPSMAIPIV